MENTYLANGQPTLSLTFGKICLDNRLNQYLTQCQLAQKAEVPLSVIKKIEVGRAVSLKDLELVLLSLGLSKKVIGESIIEVE